jgi:CheY-like chemotaxis protein
MATILVADDDAVNQRLLGFVLARLGHQVVGVANGREALQHLAEAESPPDLLILDLAMPEIDGVTTLRSVRADERHRALPVVVLTASGLDRDARVAREAGANAFLTKPVRSQELADTLDHLLGEARGVRN